MQGKRGACYVKQLFLFHPPSGKVSERGCSPPTPPVSGDLRDTRRYPCTPCSGYETLRMVRAHNKWRGNGYMRSSAEQRVGTGTGDGRRGGGDEWVTGGGQRGVTEIVTKGQWGGRERGEVMRGREEGQD